MHCLVGENGAGKSTLTKILSGAITPDSGMIALGGTEYRGLTPRQAIELGVATVYQEPELIESLTVADNIYLGDEKSAAFPLMVDTRTQNARARDLIRSLRFNLKEDALVEDLSSAQKQMLQIAKARYRESKIIIMDEPTSSFGLEETNALMNLIRSLKAKGIGIIYISHFLEQIFEIADRITILKDGESMGTFPRSDIDMDTVIRKMVGRDASLFYAKEDVTPGPVQLEVRNMGRRGVVEDVSFEVRAGEIFGLGGLVGSGRSELVNLIFGADRRDSGEILIGGQPVRIRNPRDAMAAGMCLITEDRKKLAMFMPRSVAENIAIVHNERCEPPVLNLAAEGRRVRDMVRRLSIAVTDPDEQTIAELSGRQPAESRHRPLAPERRPDLHLRRADQGRGRGRPRRDLQNHGRAGEGGQEHRHGVLGHAGADLDERPHRRHAPGPADPRARPGRGSPRKCSSNTSSGSDMRRIHLDLSRAVVFPSPRRSRPGRRDGSHQSALLRAEQHREHPRAGVGARPRGFRRNAPDDLGELRHLGRREHRHVRLRDGDADQGRLRSLALRRRRHPRRHVQRLLRRGVPRSCSRRRRSSSRWPASGSSAASPSPSPRASCS